jgi:hypothetical protein
VPDEIREFAARRGVELSRAPLGKITPDESRRLYLELTRISLDARRRLRELAVRGVLTIERVCYLVHHGAWDEDEADFLLTCCPNPETIFADPPAAEARHLEAAALFHSRAALLGGHLRRALERREHRDGEGRVVLLDNDRRTVVSTHVPDLYARTYLVRGESARLHGWGARGSRLEIPPGEELIVLLRPREASGLGKALLADIEEAASATLHSHRKRILAVAVPFEIHSLEEEDQENLHARAKERSVRLLICPEKVAALDAESRRRFRLGRFVRA